ncbi:hypothetical protein QK289_14220 [Exiguobacterium antarcticum]|uniref:Uncharacterized protein n=1 Tax=Exiguobacterium antarcticum TaxID=132920 RepID=A0ABT6R5D4_9BACL|nr:hypothetical protein [Exiguobacterium antarcticum]MDI3236166.1 hypothetical protein [Exiguobacterium antarcticum]
MDKYSVFIGVGIMLSLVLLILGFNGGDDNFDKLIKLDNVTESLNSIVKDQRVDKEEKAYLKDFKRNVLKNSSFGSKILTNKEEVVEKIIAISKLDSLTVQVQNNFYEDVSNYKEVEMKSWSSNYVLGRMVIYVLLAISGSLLLYALVQRTNTENRGVGHFVESE